MTDYKPGDTAKVIFEAEIVEVTDRSVRLDTGNQTFWVSAEAVESVKPKHEPLPSDDGYYQYAPSGMLCLADGKWFNVIGNYREVTADHVRGLRRNHGLVRLRPEADVRREVLNEVAQFVSTTTLMILMEKFGVTA